MGLSLKVTLLSAARKIIWIVLRSSIITLSIFGSSWRKANLWSMSWWCPTVSSQQKEKKWNNSCSYPSVQYGKFSFSRPTSIFFTNQICFIADLNTYLKGKFVDFCLSYFSKKEGKDWAKKTIHKERKKNAQKRDARNSWVDWKIDEHVWKIKEVNEMLSKELKFFLHSAWRFTNNVW